MDYNAPFLSLPDYRDNLQAELYPGQPARTTLVPDLSGNANHLITTGNITREKLYGSRTPSLCKDDDSALIKIDSADKSLYLEKTQITYLVWVAMPALPTTDGIIINFGGSNEFYINDGQKRVIVGFYDDDENKISMSGGSASMTRSAWHFVAVTCDIVAGAHCLYQDGVLIDTDDESELYGEYCDPAEGITIGNLAGQSGGNELQIAMIRIYKEAMTADNINKVFQLTRRRIMGFSPKL